MLLNILIAALMMVITTSIHAGGMAFVLQRAEQKRLGLRTWLRRSRLAWIVSIVLIMFMVALLEALAWACAYLALGAIEGLEQALYFSTVTFTTLGYGEIVLDERWRLLASFEAANGIIMFGWTTAIVIAAVQHTYFGQKADAEAT